jgi:hypothetical protein
MGLLAQIFRDGVIGRDAPFAGKMVVWPHNRMTRHKRTRIKSSAVPYIFCIFAKKQWKQQKNTIKFNFTDYLLLFYPKFAALLKFNHI